MSWNQKQAANRKKKLQIRRKKGLCLNCGAESNYKPLCARCLEKKTELQQARRLKRKKAGVCPCGSPLAEGLKRCKRCYERKRKANRLYRHDK